MTIRRTFRTERGLRAYDLENDEGEKLSLEEAEGSLSFRRGDEKSIVLAPEFTQELIPLLDHYSRYGNLPLPEIES